MYQLRWGYRSVGGYDIPTITPPSISTDEFRWGYNKSWLFTTIRLENKPTDDNGEYG